MPEEETEFHQNSWAERVENGLRVLWPLLLEDPDNIDIQHSEIWVSAQRLAKDFEATHQVVKQPRLDEDSVGLYQFIGGNSLWLADAELHVPFATQDDESEEAEDEYTSEITIKVDSPILVRYMDIQPGSTRVNELDDYYHGPHLICEFTISQAIMFESIQIPEGEHIGFIPFRKIFVDEQHIPRQLN